MPATRTEIQELRAALNIDNASVILINGGARGGGPLLKVYETIRKAATHSNILVVCGKNGQLRQRIERRRDPKTRTFGFVQDVYRYIAAADIVVTKPGALSAYEALACKVPVLFTGLRCLMPQESGMFHAAQHYDFGFVARTFDELDVIIRKGAHEWKRKCDSISQFYQRESALDILKKIQPIHVSS